jgi:hypothetical protein
LTTPPKNRSRQELATLAPSVYTRESNNPTNQCSLGTLDTAIE